MDFSLKLKQGEQLVKDNSTTILTATAAVGTVVTAVLTGRATLKADGILREQEIIYAPEPMTNRDKLAEVWTVYAPPIGAGILTISCVIMANRLSSKKAAALAAAYGLSERAFAEYKDKVVEKIGSAKAQAVRAEVAQDRVTNNPPGTEIILASGNVLCLDMLSGRYFESTVENIKQAQNKLNHEMIHHSYVSLGAFYDEIGLAPNGMSEEIGWNMDNLIEVIFSTAMSPDKRPCIAIDFASMPTTSYNRLY